MIVRAGGCAEIKRIEEFCFAVVGHRRSGCGGECHTQRAFAPARFDHVTVGCNLMGLHGTLPCADCHKAGNYGAVSPMCVSCHRGDALRVKQPDHRTLVECGGCHNPSAWIPATQLGQQSICR